MRNILVRSIAGGSPSHRTGARRAAMLIGGAALAAVLSLAPLSFGSHGNVIGLAAAFAQSGSSTQNTAQSTDDMSTGADAGDDNGVDAAGNDAGDDNGVDAAGHDAGDDNGGTAAGPGDSSHGGSTSGPGGNSNGSGANSGTGGEDGHDGGSSGSGGHGSGGHGSSGGGD